MARLARPVLPAALAVMLMTTLGASGPASADPDPAATNGPEPQARADGTIDLGDRRQRIDGFGISQAFQRARWMQGLPPDKRREVLDLLFDRENGAGFSILRLGIGAAPTYEDDQMKSIQPRNPGGPDAEPQYVWDGDDGGQVWLARQAKEYGVERFYANPWSAPGYMKTNGSHTDGGTLCGLPDTDCASGDWRQAYADYLLQYVRFYAQEGIPITDLTFTNEPDYAPSYASMEFTPEQAADMVKVLGPTIEDSEFWDLNLLCCESYGWEHQRPYTEAIEADPEAAELVDIHTGHNYASQARSPLPTDKPTWMSEWNPDGDTWSEGWDDGTGYDGMSVAEDIHAALSQANVSAYVYWLGASRAHTRAPIQLDGDDYHVSDRLWALAAYSRFVRPDAVRVGAESGSNDVRVTAFRNADGGTVVEILNTAGNAVRQTFQLVDEGTAGRGEGSDRGETTERGESMERGESTGGGMTGDVYLTDEEHSLERIGEAKVDDQRLSVRLPARSLTTVVLD